MRERLESLKREAVLRAGAAGTAEELLDIRHQYLGKKGAITLVLKELGRLDPEERRQTGMLANEVKDAISLALTHREEALVDEGSSIHGEIDLTLPGIPPASGALHPITQMCYDLNDAFLSLGFEVYQEDEITSELYAFDNLNFPPDHPARDTMDTYWLKGFEEDKGARRLCLRPHLTGGSVRYLKKHGAPARFVYPGPCYRNENTDARHERAFFQYEALIVEKGFPFASGQLMIRTILEKVFGRKVDTRMRAGFFPFVEPGFEIDMKCLVCGGEGCKVCKHVGWIEVMPGGTPHPNVLRAAGLDPEIWSGFYINVGLDRLVMMRYGVDDVRLFRGADLRFLGQFR
ncbi:MAG: phenylalanine--tRNA ligase subunit alpha [Eubacteriales bacterium]|jgi:phenylalanyl-tRNA synthetase alpha chain|nr:phenylalanine--tRNA ligase subunit alpha [Eubacteriales bacterium]MDD4134677.1 phenylalanine--tRNA ligase subunit alpha [Eubacteriales bacterium]NLO13522.1 phenylalanine--tRNA ligase subunit alpha [Clostridiales bacterium]